MAGHRYVVIITSRNGNNKGTETAATVITTEVDAELQKKRKST